ncbi:FAD-binding and (Fe-S)-binding domain-containing protein [Kibdelosporangium persicum]|uniref:Anaerobic glycerol-3-phosphate dehydrogenase subunit C n=1 Tax=Kibdelosporangium persicum TaxID=2698649 RepID=A0ABX2EX46_9PSEU|nr:FAD-binding and (Fe-S)-binding domain-containing protein [Kibdelosporangium persicum]NRN63380.1 Anaerobic glycerol-3-phosphate dehydrogenase subunit C [Kibdelosporangium persicum]
MSDLAEALRKALDGEVAFDSYTRHLFSRDASMYSITPEGVVFPRHSDDVVAAVSIARSYGVPVLARGGGTSLAGQTVGPGVVLDFSRHMNRILALDPEAGVAHVQPGVVQDDLNRAASAHGMMFGPDTSTSNRATIGGMIGNNSAGSGSVRYGMTIDHVRSLEVVLSDGNTATFAPGTPSRFDSALTALVDANRPAIADGFPRFWRRAGGYRLDRLADGPFDLAKFVVGSEGTLVVATSAVVGLVPKPKHTVIAVGHFTSIEAAIAATDDALACDPAAVELIDKTILDLSRQKLEYRRLASFLAGDPEALLFVTFTGDTQAAAVAELDRLASLWEKHSHGYHTLRAETPAQQNALLKVRKAGLGLLMASSVGSRRPQAFVEDTAVHPSRLIEYSTRFREILSRHGMKAGFYGHASVGCLHVRPFVDLTNPDEVAAMRAVAEEVRDLVVEFGGANSSEHGDGLVRSEFNRTLFGDTLYEAMRQAKHIFDPDNVLNPGKIVDSPAMTDHLRDPALPAAKPLTTHLTFLGDMRSAADRCMNIGLCRKSATGVMCPSYMATRNEEDSTRGRANALVKALSSADPAAALGDSRLHEVLDLCLMCKACKSECPLGVDMAALKSETLAQKHAQSGTPLRSRVFGAIRTMNRLGSATAPVSNLAGRFRFARRLLGIAAQRPLPEFKRENLIRWFRRHTGSTSGRTVTFLADSFTTFTEPGVGRAAISLLEQAGWQVRLESSGCCGRAGISKGLLDDAKTKATALTARLAATDGPIVGCEPSCVYTLQDEYLSLLPDNPAVKSVAARVRQVEELLVEAIDQGELRLGSQFDGRKILYHGHCHQKAEVGTAATVELLRRIPGATVTELDAGCCGMAGSFGFEAEHYDISMQVGEDRLFPAIRSSPADTIVAATGVSCRQQIRHGTERRARHPVELIAECAVDSAV